MDQHQVIFSIVIPTYNRPKKMATLLEKLALLDYPRDHFEVVVVDDGSERSPEAAIAPFKNDLNIVLLSTAKRAGPAKARQTGINAARGKFLAFTDDDCSPNPNWLKMLEAEFAKSPTAAIGGQTVNALADNLYSSASQSLMTYLYTRFNTDPSKANYFATNNLAFPAEQFRSIGGLDLTWSISGGEDRDLCERWLRHGYRMVYAPEVVVYHAHDLTFRTFLRQHFNYGRGSFRYHYVQSYPKKEKVGLEPLSFYLRLPLFPFSKMPFMQAVLIAILLAVAQVATGVGFFSEWKRDV